MPILAATRRVLSTATVTSVAGLALLASHSAHAGLLDGLSDAVGSVVKTKTESRETLVVYDLAGFAYTEQGEKDLLDAVRNALTYHGDNAHVNTGALTGTVPELPGKLTLKPLGMNLPVPVSISFPVCDGAAFTVSSSDNSLARAGDSSTYMACAFRYAGGYRVSFYARSSETSGGIGGLLSGKTIAKAVTKAAGLDTDAQAFINASINKLEQTMTARNWAFAIVEMRPTLEGKVVVADPLLEVKAAQANETVRAEQKARRLAARGELRKLGYDAADVAQFRKAIAAGDEDIVELFMDAGAVDPKAADETGKPLTEYASKPSVRVLLAKR